MQIFLEFETAFWEGRVPAETGQFGITLPEGAHSRGMASTIWNFKPFTDAPILCSLLIGASAERMATMSDDAVEAKALAALRAVFGADGVPPVARRVCARWGEDEFARGSYSYVAVGGSGDSYDLLARPLGRALLFAGEHTTKEHLDTVGGAMRTGVREAARAIAFFEAGTSVQAQRMATLASDEAFQDTSEALRPLSWEEQAEEDGLGGVATGVNAAGAPASEGAAAAAVQAPANAKRGRKSPSKARRRAKPVRST